MSAHPRSIDPDADDELESADSFGESVPALLSGLDEWQRRAAEPALSWRDIAWGAVVTVAFTMAGCVAGLLHRGG